MSDFANVMWRSLLIVLVTIIGLAFVYFSLHAMRRRWSRPIDRTSYTLEELDALRQQGTITEVEFKALRSSIFAQSESRKKGDPPLE